MGGFHFLDLMIGLTFIYFLLSIICLSLQELKANLLNERSKNLKKWITDTFNHKEKHDTKPCLGDRIWNNILVDGLTQSKRTASYIPKEVMISVLLDEIYYGSDDSIKGKNKESAIENEREDKESLKPTYDFNSIGEVIESQSTCLPSPFRRVIRQVYSESHENLETFKMRLERWFEMAMERNSGTYKKKAQRWTLGFAIIVTIAINVDSLKLASHFYDNPSEAKRIADQAEKYIQNNPELVTKNEIEFKETVKAIRADINRMKELKLPLGWEGYIWLGFTKEGITNIFLTAFKSLPGWIITIFAVSLGSTFWFDTLNKLVNLRAAGNAPNGVSTPYLGKDNKSINEANAVG